jgi:hypothetical protein
MTVDTSKIIRKVAKERFVGHGLKQKGQSRLWYFSGDYYLILIEFQPSSWEKGTYLNVGLDFNWYPKDYFAFEFGYRLSDFKSPKDEGELGARIQQLCDLALDKVNEYKQIFIDKKTAGDKLLRLHKDKSNDWEKFNLGVLFGLGGHNEQAINYLKGVTGAHYKLDWEIEREKIAREYINAIGQGDFLTKLSDMITRTKQLKRIS